MLRKMWKGGRRLPRRSGVAAFAIAAMLVPTLAAARQPAQPNTGAFEQVWQRPDMPVAQGVAKRSWLWGPVAIDNRTEALLESPGGKRQVRYYDKSRMEINDPNGDPRSPWFVTNGLLVVEMISGHMQVGFNTFEPREPSQVPVAGDVVTAGARNLTPTYAALARVATIDPNQNRSQPRIGQEVRESLTADGTVRPGPLEGDVGRIPKLQQYESVTGHNIPDVFWDFMNQRGTVYENGQYREGQLFNSLYAMGYPLTEPYWITIEIQGKRFTVMMQAFQRRILTYNPSNELAWRVEMGNVGLQYHTWRYGSGPAPLPSPGPKEDGVPLRLRHFSELQIGPRYFSGIDEPLYVAVSNQSEWDALWKRHSIQANPTAPAPAVDFKSEFVIAAFWGDKRNACFRLDITGVRLLEADRKITAAVSRVERDGICAQVVTQPHDFVVVSKVGLTPNGPTKYDVVFSDGERAFSETQVTLP